MERVKRLKENRLASYRPYPKQRLFHALSGQYQERMLMAANQVGKTWSAGYEVAMHLTGLYPDWWQGRRYRRPTTWWVASESMELGRDGQQRILFGRDGERGTGSIPLKNIVRIDPWSGVKGAVAGGIIRHSSGGLSRIACKSYDQGRTKFQAETLDGGIWFDEESDEDIYMEGLTRTNTTNGLVIITFTPLKGHTKVVDRFLTEESEHRVVVTMTLDDAEHYSEEQKAKLIKQYPKHQVKARTLGIPVLGEGEIFPVDEDKIRCSPFPIPEHWPRIGGLDFGWDHPFAAVEMAYDPEMDVLYVTKEYRESQASALVHVAALKPWGNWLPWAWPHDGLQHDKGSGEVLKDQYDDLGLHMLPERATFSDGSNGVEAGLMEMLTRMETGRWKVFSTCPEWMEEKRVYHREKGKVVKLKDDLISASRYAMMMRRYARTKPPIGMQSTQDPVGSINGCSY